MSGLIFERSRRIRFSDCDSTGLVFHAEFFRWAVDMEESFFREILGEAVFGPGVTRKFYTPMAGIRAEFVQPLRAGDDVTERLWAERVGRSSICWAYEIRKGGKSAIKIRETLVFTFENSDGTFRAAEIPSDFKEKIELYLCSSEEKMRFREVKI